MSAESALRIRDGAMSCVKAVETAVKHRDLCRSCLSKNTALTIQAAFSWALPEQFGESDLKLPEIIAVTDLVYRGNNFFDIGYWAWEKMITTNSAYRFPALEKIYSLTRSLAEEELNKLIARYPELEMLARNFLSDGIALASSKGEFRNDNGGLLYREIDSAMSATLYFGAIFGADFLKEIGVSQDKCRSRKELEQKYFLFLNTHSLSKKQIREFPREKRMAVGMQAIEMILACIDDKIAGQNDQLLGLPNSRQSEMTMGKLIDLYTDTALECGFPRLAIEVIKKLIFAHELQTKRTLKIPRLVELHQLGPLRQFERDVLLREFLENSGVLSQL